MAVTDGWSNDERWLFNDLLGAPDGWEYNADTYDPMLAELFNKAMFDMDISSAEREEAYQAMVNHFWNEYGLDFEDVFDWEDYRSWYDNT